MKSKLLSILLLFFSANLVKAQDWAAFHSTHRYLYGVEGRLPVYGSVSLPGRLLVPFGDTSAPGNPHETSYNNHWLGEPIFNNLLDNGLTGQYNVDIPTAGVMSFFPVSTLGGIAATFGQLQARIVSKTLDTVLGVPDSVATLKWESATVTSHPLLNDSANFLLSKSFGLIRFRNFGDFEASYELWYKTVLSFGYSELFVATVTLMGIPYLGLGSQELTLADYPLPSVGDELETMGEHSYYYFTGGWGSPCVPTSGFSVSLSHKKCIAVQNLSGGQVMSTWKTISASSNQPFQGPVFSTDTGIYTHTTSDEDDVFLNANNGIGYYMGANWDQVFYGQFESNTGISLRLAFKSGIDQAPWIEINPIRASETLGNSIDNPNGWSGPCSTNAPGIYSLHSNIPIYIKQQGHHIGKPIVITGSRPILDRETLHLTPNPTTSDLWISSPEMIRSLSIVNALGKVMKEGVPGSDGKVQVGDLPAGVYQLQWFGVDGEGGTVRVLKE